MDSWGSLSSHVIQSSEGACLKQYDEGLLEKTPSTSL